MIEFHEMQRKLDKTIIEKHNLKGINLFENKIISLDVELSEFFNEVESFKHWKIHKGKKHILEECCDAFHFLLSISNDFKHILAKPTSLIIEPSKGKNVDYMLINRKMVSIKKTLWVKFRPLKDPYLLNTILRDMITILNMLGYTFKDLENAYIKKNKINFERQEGDY